MHQENNGIWLEKPFGIDLAISPDSELFFVGGGCILSAKFSLLVDQLQNINLSAVCRKLSARPA